MNIHTVKQMVKGLALYLEQNSVNYKDRGIVIAYNSRDAKKDAELAAGILGTYRIRTYILNGTRPAPILSFAVRYVSAVAGIMITPTPLSAQGTCKLYNEKGSPVSNAETAVIFSYAHQVKKTGDLQALSVGELKKKHLLRWIKHEMDQAYLEKLQRISKIDEQIKQHAAIQVVCTAKENATLQLVAKGLNQIGITDVHPLKKQMQQYAFPELDHAYLLLADGKQGKIKRADILLELDDAAYRVALAEKNTAGKYVSFTSNQLGVLLFDYIVRHTEKQWLYNARLIHTKKTAELIRLIANTHGIKTIEALEGFTGIGEHINHFNATGELFLFGCNEDYGYLIDGFTREQDGIQAAVLSCEMALYWKNKGISLLERYNELYEKYSYTYAGGREKRNKL